MVSFSDSVEPPDTYWCGFWIRPDACRLLKCGKSGSRLAQRSA